MKPSLLQSADSHRLLGVDPNLLIFKFDIENQLCKTKPKVFPWGKGKNVWFRQCLMEKLRHFHFGSSLHSLGVKWPRGTQQPEKRLSQPTCSNKPRNFSSGPGSGRPLRFLAGHCPFLELHRFLSLSIWIIERPFHSHLISDGTWCF